MAVPANKITPNENDSDLQRPVMKKIDGIKTEISFIDRLDKINSYVNNFLGWLAGASLMLMVFLVVGNAIVRTVYKPFAGTTEVVGWLAAITTAFALGYTQLRKGYVDIDALMQNFPEVVQRVVRFLMDVISLSFFTMVAWKMFEYSSTVAQNGNLSETMGIPYYHLIILVGVGFVGLCFAIFIDLLRQVAGGGSK